MENIFGREKSRTSVSWSLKTNALNFGQGTATFSLQKHGQRGENRQLGQQRAAWRRPWNISFGTIGSRLCGAFLGFAARAVPPRRATPCPSALLAVRRFIAPRARPSGHRRGQIVKPCDRAAISLSPHPSTCRDSPPIAASSSAAREGVLSGCAHSDRGVR